MTSSKHIPTSGDGKSYTDAYSWSTNQCNNENEKDYASQRVGGTDTAIATGVQNTKRILKKYPASRYPNSAAAVARAYSGGGYHDWYLPSKDELAQLYRNKSAVGVFSATYWSSSERGAQDAWDQYFGDGQHFNFVCNKYVISSRVRAVRAF